MISLRAREIAATNALNNNRGTDAEVMIHIDESFVTL
jgi:hypothetical protein